MSRLLKLYPRPWRQRYEEEVLAVIEQRPLSLGDRIDLLTGIATTWYRTALRERHRPRRWRTGLQLVTQGAVALAVATVVLVVGNHNPAQSPVAIEAARGYNPGWQLYQTEHDYQITVDNLGKLAIPHLLVELRSQRHWQALAVSTSPHRAVRTLSSSPYASTWDFGNVGRWDILRVVVKYSAIPRGSGLVFLSLHAYGNTTRSGQPELASQIFSLPCTAIYVEGPLAHAGQGPSLKRVTRHGCTG